MQKNTLMVLIEQQIRALTIRALKSEFNVDYSKKDLSIQMTRKDFEGDFTLVCFPFTKLKLGAPQMIAEKIGTYILESSDLILNFNVVKGFLNLSIKSSVWLDYLNDFSQNPEQYLHPNYGNFKKVVMEYPSPNTNKPLHLGHLRNMFLGDSVSNILKTVNFDVVRTCLYNDRGTNICKSIYAWQENANGATPESTQTKGDYFVGDYYVQYNNIFTKEVEELIASGVDKEEAKKEANSVKKIQEINQNWENGDEEVLEVWKKMNTWVYQGFEETYKKLGITLDKNYYESDTYLIGRDFVLDALEKGVLYQKEDSSVWADLSEYNLDDKLLLRKDGTSLYMTQDLGTAQLKYDDYQYDISVYVIGNEQNHHMKVLKIILNQMGKSYADGIYHLSYGMVELPEGKMKSREGTVVEADTLVNEMLTTAKKQTDELGKTEGMTEEELKSLYEMLGLGALKYFLLKVDPTKNMLFNPAESIDLKGHTGPFIQYTHARIKSILRNSELNDFSFETENLEINAEERTVINKLYLSSETLVEAAKAYNPAIIANYAFELAKDYNRFVQTHSILNAQTKIERNFRLSLSLACAKTLSHFMQLLGILLPEKM